jgi:hypothetical protein
MHGCLPFFLAFFFMAVASQGAELPFSSRFVGQAKFQQLMDRAEKEGWNQLPLGRRTEAFGLALCGTAYAGHTLEIDDRIETVSANFNGLDCWTFFETSLAMARLMEEPVEKRTPEHYLRYLEMDRYHMGTCTGAYLSRLHYLVDWRQDNEKRGLVRDVTRGLPGAERHYNICREMSLGWKGYRYLRSTPALLPLMTGEEKRITQLPCWHIPKNRVATIESKIEPGDVLCITTRYKGAFCSHVGLARRDKNGVLRFMHASSQKEKRKVLVDARLSDYLYSVSGHAGVMIVRPLPVPPNRQELAAK